MYIKVVQFTSTSKMQKEMLGAYLQTVWFPELIKLGALSCRYVSLDDTKAMIINMFPDEDIGESVQVGREEQRKELREQHKYTVFKGYSECRRQSVDIIATLFRHRVKSIIWH